MTWMIPGLASSSPSGHFYHVHEVLYGHSHQMTWMIPGHSAREVLHVDGAEYARMYLVAGEARCHPRLLV